MDLFGVASGERKERLQKFKKIPSLFSTLENSTCSVDGFLVGISFNEEEIIDLLECEGNIIKIDCNYGHKVSLSYNTEPAERKSNRGRKKKEKTRKMRKYQGDGSSFN